MNSFNATVRVNMGVVVKLLGQKDDDVQEWLVLTPKDKIPKPEKEAYPRPPKRPDGSYIYDRVPPTAAAVSASSITQQVNTISISRIFFWNDIFHIKWIFHFSQPTFFFDISTTYIKYFPS